jgi:excisionase family DNA binding protein
MTLLSLREAAQQARTSKSTILRAIQKGRLSASRTDDGGYAIQPAELFRVYPPKAKAVATDHCADQSVGQDAPHPATPGGVAGDTVKLAVMEAELAALKDMVAELKQARDDWKAQAERLAITGPTKAAEPARSWWKRLAG